MPYLNDKGYCRKCERITSHRFSLIVKCLNCKIESIQEEYRKGIKN
jgi:hypothetical protein